MSKVVIAPGTAVSPFELLGPITLGIMFSIFGMGILLMQTIAYLDSSPTDSSSLMGIILLILGLSVGQTISDCSRLMKIDVWHAGDFAYYFDVRNRPEEVISPSFSLIICTVAQLFLLRRCIVFARLAAPSLREQDGWVRYARVVWRVMLFLGIVMSMICGIISVIGLSRLHSLLEASRTTHPETLLARWSVPWLGTTSATDICLSATLLWELRTARKNQETSHKGKRAIRAMIRVAWSNGVLVGALQLTSLIFLLVQLSSWCDFAQIFISKAYSITLLASITSPISALRGSSNRPAPPPPAPRHHTSPHTPTPLPMLFMHKNPSAEWSPYSPDDAKHTPFPLRNAECASAEHARGDGRARLHSLTSVSSDWDGDSTQPTEGAPMGSPEPIPITLQTPKPALGNGWREHVLAQEEEERDTRITRGRTLMGRPKRVERSPRALEEEISMDVRVEGGGSRTFGSVGGVPGDKTFGSVGEAM